MTKNILHGNKILVFPHCVHHSGVKWEIHCHANFFRQSNLEEKLLSRNFCDKRVAKKNSVISTQCGNNGILLPQFFRKFSVKLTIHCRTLLWKWFDGKNSALLWIACFFTLCHSHDFLRETNFYITQLKFTNVFLINFKASCGTLSHSWSSQYFPWN